MLSALAVAGALTAFVAGLTGAWSPCGFSMVDTIGAALGDVRSSMRRLACWAFALGCLCGGAATFLGLAELGRILVPGAAGVREALGATLALAAAVADWRGMKIAPQIRRQVPESWRWRMPLPLACALYGVLLGLGFTTFVLAFATWALAGVSFASASPLTGLSIGLAFGVGRALPILWIAPRLGGGETEGARLLDRMAREPRLWLGLRRVDALGLGLCAVFMSGAAAAAGAVLPSASDPSTSGGVLVWQEVGGTGMLLAGSGPARTLPGYLPALGPSTIAWEGNGEITIANSLSLAVRATLPVSGVSALAVSEGWVVYRQLEANGRESLIGVSLLATRPPLRIAGPLPAGEIGRPSVDGSAAVFTIDTTAESAIELVHLPSGHSRTLRAGSRGILYENPSLLDGEVAYERVTRCAQELRLASARETTAGRLLLELPSTVTRDSGYEEEYEHAYNMGSVCPNRGAGSGSKFRLGPLALSETSVYVTEVPEREAPAGARIVTVARAERALARARDDGVPDELADVAEQGGKDAAERFLGVGVAGALRDEHGDRHPDRSMAQECDLVLDFAGAGAPAALEVELPPRQL